jgi:SAM-dependent methyltransferase
MNNFWDTRYSSEEFIYGTEPNIFFKTEIDKISPGRLFGLAEGEGRNGIYAACLGWEVDAVDFSWIARKKALKLASEKGVNINNSVTDLADFEPGLNKYDAVSMIFMHLNPPLSKMVHKRASESLKPEGKIIPEVYHKDQIGKSSGGPQNYDMLYSIDEISENFGGLKTELLRKEIIHLNESKYHSGEAAVVKFVGKKIA